MRLHYLRGENAAGLAAYKRLADRMRVQFGSAPSRASDELAEALRRGAVVAPPPLVALSAPSASAAPRAGGTAAAAAPAAPRPTLLPMLLKRPPRLVGRSAELAAARAAWAEGRVVLLEGEAGLGKSRLIGELVASTRPTPTATASVLSGTATLLSAGRPGDGGSPYSTLARCIEPLLRREVSPRRLPELQALRHLETALAPPPTSEHVETVGEAAQLRPGALERAVTALLRSQGIETLVLDDLHFADDATIDLLSALAATPDAHTKWLFAERPAEASSASHRLRDALTELGLLKVVALAPLGVEATAALIDDLEIPDLQASRLAADLTRHTGGNPLYLLETIKLGLGDGSFARGTLPRPEGVGALIERRLQRLSESALTLARIAAIAGSDLSLDLAEAVSGTRAVTLASAWAELEAAQVFRDQGFAHDLVLETTRQGVPAVVARHVHASVARYLEAHHASPGRIAAHWQAAGESRQGLPWLHAAARQAGSTLRRNEQVAFLEAAAQIEEAAGLPAAFDTLTAIVDAWDIADKSRIDDDLMARLERAAELGPDVERRRVTAMSSRVISLLVRGDAQAAVELGERAMEAAGRCGAWLDQVHLAQFLAAALSTLGQAPRGVDLLRTMLPTVERLQGEPGVKGSYYIDLATLLGSIDLPQESAAFGERGVELEHEAGNLEHACMGMATHGFTLLTSGHGDRALQVLLDADRRLAGSEGSEGARHVLPSYIGRAMREAGRYNEALIWTRRSIDIERTQSPQHLALTHAQEGLLWLRLGQTARASQALARARRADLTSPHAIAALLVLEGRIARATGRDSEGPWREAIRVAPRDQRRSIFRIALAESLRLPTATVRDLDEAVEAADDSHARGMFGIELALRTLAACLATRLGDSRRASSLVETAAALSDRHWAFDLYAPEIWLLQARVRKELGKVDDALAALGRASEWVLQSATRHVPPEYLHSFLHRNEVNAALLSEIRAWPELGVQAVALERLAFNGDTGE